MIPDTTLPGHRNGRWALLDTLVERWYAPVRFEAGIRPRDLDRAESRLAVSLPLAVRELYERFGNRADVLSPVDRLLAPTELEVRDGVLVMLREAQNVVRWGVRVADLRDEDPPIVVSRPAGASRWIEQSPSTSAFALCLTALNAKWSESVAHAWNGQIADRALPAKLERGALPRLPFDDLHWPPFPTRLYGTEDLVIETQADTWIWVTALSDEAFGHALDLVEGHLDVWQPNLAR